MTDNDTGTDETGPELDIDIRTDDDKAADDELSQLLEEYKAEKGIDSDQPADDRLRDLSTQMTDDTTDSDHDDTTTDSDATGKTHVSLSGDGDADAPPSNPPEEVPDDIDADEAETTSEDAITFGEQVDDDPEGDAFEADPEAIEAAAADDETKAQRRAELEADGHLDADGGDDTPPSQTAQQPHEQRYDISTRDVDALEDDAGGDADGGDPEPRADLEESPPIEQPSTSPDEAEAMAQEFDAEFEDVLEDGLFTEVDDIDPDEFDFEAQDVEDASQRKGDKIIELNGVYFLLRQPEGDTFYNMLDHAQQATDIEARHNLLINYVVERPHNAGERVEDWSGAARAQLATECAIHSGLHEMQDFQ